MAFFFVRLAYCEQAPPNQQVLIHQDFFHDHNCDNCTAHVELASEMIRILKRINSGANSLRPLEQARLDFLFYTVRSENKHKPCHRISSLETFHTRFSPNELAIVSDQILDLPNLSEIVIAPYKTNQIVYTFRGVGTQKNTLMELITGPDGVARLRTYSYKSNRQQQLEKLPQLTFTPEQRDDKNQQNLSFQNDHFVLGVKTNSKSLKSDETSILANESRTNLSRDIDNLFNNGPGNTGATQVSIKEHEGREWMILSAQSNADFTSHELITAAPMSLVLDPKSNLRINTTLKNELQLARTQESLGLDHAQGAMLDLSNDQHRFVGVEVYQRESDRYNRLAVFNHFEVVKGNTLGSRFESDNQGNRVISVTNTTKFAESSNLQIEGGERNSQVFFTIRSVHKLTENSSFSIGAASSKDRKNEFVLQFRADF